MKEVTTSTMGESKKVSWYENGRKEKLHIIRSRSAS